MEDDKPRGVRLICRRLLAVDPGRHAIAVALFVDKQLDAARMYVIEDDEISGACWQTRYFVASHVPDRVVVELPQVYAAGKSKGRPSDLIDLAAIAGAAAGAARAASLIHPSEWKGQIPKKRKDQPVYLIEERAKRRLSPSEIARVQLPASRALHHNVWDAIGIGLWALGR